MNYKAMIAVLVTAVLLLGFSWIRKEKPKIWDKIELPFYILKSGVCLWLSCWIGYAMYQTAIKDTASTSEKIFGIVFCGLVVVLFAWSNTADWRSWIRKHRKKK